MVEWIALYAVIAKMAVLGAGIVILYFTASAARHTGDQGLWFLSVGILLAGIALVSFGMLSTLLGIAEQLEVALTNTFAAIGLGLIVYSIFTEAPVQVSE